MPPVTTDDDLRLTSSPPEAMFWGMTRAGTRVPDEVPPPVSVASDRFVNRVEHIDFSKRDAEGLSRVSREILGLLDRCRPGGERADLIEEALLIEASAASLKEISAAVQRPEILPTDHGDLQVIRYRAWTPVLSKDVGNPRPILRLGMAQSGGYSYVPPVLAEYDDRGLRTLDFRDTEHFAELHRAHREALGFKGMVRDHRDRLDLERGTRLGILKQGVATMTRVVDRATGASGLQITLVDANRRHTFSERIHEAVMPAFGFGKFSRRHFFDGENLTFRRFTQEDAHGLREGLADAYSFLDGPAPTGDLDPDRRNLEEWAEYLEKEHPDRAAVVRTRVMYVQLIVGVDPHSALAAANPVTVAVGAYRDQLHLRDLADLGWDKNAQEASVGQELLRRSRETTSVVPYDVDWQYTVLFDPMSARWHAPDVASTHDPAVAAEAAGVEASEVVQSAPGVAALAEGVPPAVPVEDAPDWFPNVLDLILATTATIVCRAQPMTPIVKEVLGHHRLTNNPKSRAELAASALLPLLQLPAEGSETARASAALARTLSHGVVYKLDEAFDPLPGQKLRWVDLLDWNWFEIVERARKEMQAGRGLTAHGERRYGPAQTLLTLAAAICLEVSPILVTSNPREDAFAQLTLSGLGGQHGSSRAEPLAVLLPLVITEEGITQLWEAVVAAIGSDHPRVARSIRWNPDKQHDKPNGEKDARWWSPFLTEYDLRGETWGHQSIGVGGKSLTDGSGTNVYRGAAAYVATLFEDAASQLEHLVDEVGPVTDLDNRDKADPALNPEADAYNGSPASAFYGDGVDPRVAERISEATDKLHRAATTGKAIRIQSGRI